MSDAQYYRVELDDYAAPSFTSFGKSYFGTLDDVRSFISALENDPEDGKNYAELISAFHAFEQGDSSPMIHVAYNKVPLLKPTRLLFEETLKVDSYSWEHQNIWGFPYHMRCSQINAKHLWLECEGKFYRSIMAQFTNLQYGGTIGQWKAIGGMIWGHPGILEKSGSVMRNRLAEREKTFDSLNELNEDHAMFQNKPDPDYTEFCNDIFGDG